MSFRDQIEENKRDLEAERKEKIKKENEEFAWRVLEIADHIRDHLLWVAKKIEKGYTTKYNGFLHINSRFCLDFTEEDVSTFWTKKMRYSYNLKPGFNALYKALSTELKKDDIWLGKPFSVSYSDWGEDYACSWWNDYKAGCGYEYFCISDWYLDNRYAGVRREVYSGIANSEHYDMPYSVVVEADKYGWFPWSHPALIIPFYYEF